MGFSVAGLSTSRANRLSALEEPLSLVARDNLVELRLLSAGVVEVVVDHVVTESLPHHLSLFQAGDGVTERVWEPLHVRLVGIAGERRPKLQLLLDAVQSCGD